MWRMEVRTELNSYRTVDVACAAVLTSGALKKPRWLQLAATGEVRRGIRAPPGTTPKDVVWFFMVYFGPVSTGSLFIFAVFNWNVLGNRCPPHFFP